MKKRVSYIIILSLIVALFLNNNTLGQPKDITGWSKSRWGMTEEEILKAFEGEAIQLQKKETLRDGSAYATIGIDNVDIGRHKYKIRFYMDTDKKTLKQVSITPYEENPIELQFKSLEQLLVEKYGPPSYKDERRDFRIGDNLKSAWNFPSTTIELSYVEFKELYRTFLVLVYRQRLASENL